MKIQRSLAACAAFLLVSAFFICAQIITPQTPLTAAQEGNVIVAKLKDGDSLFVKLAQISKEYTIQSGVILFDIGQLRDFSIGQYNPVSKRFVSKSFLTPWELVSLQGTIAYGSNDGGLLINCMATLADSSGCTVAGHLSKGIVSIINEITILKLSNLGLFRRYNVQLGLWELQILQN